MKKLLFLGAATFQIPPIQYALQQGYTVITVDNQPTNEGHHLAHRSYNISTTEKEQIVQLAETEQIDGIVCYGSDIAASTAAYVAEKLNLVGSSYETILTLTNKALFRHFLTQHQLQQQSFKSFTLQQYTQIEAYLQKIKFPVVVKPVDASGSKGVSVIRDLSDQWEAKIARAFQYSLSKTIIIEQFITKKGRQICGDGYMENGKLRFIELGDGHFYDEPPFHAPYAETFPSQHSAKDLQKVKYKLEKILQQAGYHNGTFNLDVMITTDNEVFVNEIGPRSGGNYIPLAIKLISHVDLIAAVVERSLNPNFQLDCHKKRSPYVYACYMIHSKQNGTLQSITFDKSIVNNIIYNHPYLKVGILVEPFYQANKAIGNIVLKFENEVEMHQKMGKINELCRVSVT